MKRSRFERVCPECGASNALSKSRCAKCGTALTSGGAARQNPPVVLSRRVVARLAWRATKFVAQLGWNAARQSARAGVERFRGRERVNARNETIEGDYTLREWRAWSAPTDQNASNRTERVHWGPKN